ncbi:aspartate/glutamate racemase family protein [Flavobacterium algicola]|uniref:aspartate/glutamate racemase family protein n=1 Tax=Flavobacterium algicola TaxID=556529 RepID=UPI001EFDC19D|nr:amino acid racemase [Flavobacterium algicola]MCG9793002.1 amino acid racemase [Flavobacterium algicola]
MKKTLLSFLLLGLTYCSSVPKPTLQKTSTTSTIPANEMKTLGLIGGTSWHSTVEYYSAINQSINDYYGDNTNPPLLVYTLNQARVHQFQKEDNWDSIANMLVEAAKSLNKAGATEVLFCANTPHKLYTAVQEKLNFPVLHIADATAQAIHKRGIKKVAFIGTKYSMQEDFITKRIEDNGIEVLVPNDAKVIDELHRIIIEELTYGKVNKESKKYVIRILNEMIKDGAEGVILGCTEFPLMIFEGDLDVPIFDTTKIHSDAAVDYILDRK